MMHPLRLGASLYVPATRLDLTAIGNREKYPYLRSVIFCTEDAIGPDELPRALIHLEAALCRFVSTPLLRFVRVRNPETFRRIVQMPGAHHLTGFVFPKVTRHNLAEYFAVLPVNHGFQMMLTLETADVFDCAEMAALRTLLLENRVRQNVLSLRIGGNDLLQLLGLRRPRRRSIYATPLGTVIGQLVTTFRPHGFNLTGPVFEYLDRPADLARETRLDVAHGLFGKSAIHPDQVPMIEAEYRVSACDLQAAEKILADGAPSIFRLDDAMCEPATHHVWAQTTIERAAIYGIRHKTPIARPIDRNFYKGLEAL